MLAEEHGFVEHLRHTRASRDAGISMRVFLKTVMLAMLAAAPACAAGLAPCAGPIEAKGVHVIRVEKNGDLVLADGRAVRLEGLLLPAGSRDQAPAYLAEQAVATLGDLARDR